MVGGRSGEGRGEPADHVLVVEPHSEARCRAERIAQREVDEERERELRLSLEGRLLAEEKRRADLEREVAEKERRFEEERKRNEQERTALAAERADWNSAQLAREQEVQAQ